MWPGPEPNSSEGERDPFFLPWKLWSAFLRFLFCLVRLLGWGANPAMADRSGMAPVHYCAREDMVECLLEMLRDAPAPAPAPTGPQGDGTRSRPGDIEDYENSEFGDDGGGSDDGDYGVGDGRGWRRAKGGQGRGGGRGGGGRCAAALTSTKQTPLHVACRAGAVRCAQLLSRWDADARRGSGLHEAIDTHGKVAHQLLHSSAPSSCLDTLWQLARRGDAVRLVMIAIASCHLLNH